MPGSILCPRHGQTASVLACEHVSAAVSSGVEPPVYRRLGVTVDHASTVAYYACFACANQFELASEIRASPGADAEECKFPKSDPICTSCLKQTLSPPAADPAPMGSESANSFAQPSGMPIQVTAAVLLLCVSVGIQAVTWAVYFVHQQTTLFGGTWVVVNACLTYGIWMRHSHARDIYAGICVLNIMLIFLMGSTINTLCITLALIPLSLLYIGPGATWFKGQSWTSYSN